MKIKSHIRDQSLLTSMPEIMAALCISILIYLIYCISKIKCTRRRSVKSSTIYIRPLFFIAVLFALKMVKVFKSQILNVRKRYFFLVQDKFVFSYFISLQLFCINCRAFHAGSPGIFYFINTIY